jgi:TetR/AcrR family transcriptional repressor of lmrAB and yxaGH operons
MSSTREQFIQTTCELMESQGYYATGLNQIIEESGGPKGSLYYHFPGGKEELTAEALQHVGSLVEKRIRKHLSTSDDSANAIKIFVENIAFNVEQSGYRAGGPITTVAIETASTSERLRDVCDNIYSAWQNVFAERLENDDIPRQKAETLAQVIIASIEGGIILCRTERNPTALKTVAQAMHDLVQSALTAST